MEPHRSDAIPMCQGTYAGYHWLFKLKVAPCTSINHFSTLPFLVSWRFGHEPLLQIADPEASRKAEVPASLLRPHSQAGRVRPPRPLQTSTEAKTAQEKDQSLKLPGVRRHGFDDLVCVVEANPADAWAKFRNLNLPDLQESVSTYVDYLFRSCEMQTEV